MPQCDLTSLDRSLTVAEDCLKPDRHRQVSDLDPAGRYTVRGAGVSYAPLSFGAGGTVICYGSFDRILRFDPEKEEIEVEAGISLAKLFGFLRERGFCLPVQPGHPQITVGGCIASNVHGKNQFREGLFADHVRELTLFHPARGSVRVSSSQSPEWFRLTCGGFGLTGIIQSAVLSLRKIPSSRIDVEYVPVRDLEEGASRILEMKGQSDLLYSWHDLGPWSGYRGAGFIVQGRFAQGGEDRPEGRERWQELPLRARDSWPVGVYCGPSLFLLNAGLKAYYLSWKRRETLSLFDFSFPISRKVLYYKLYGPKGFVEHQVLIPAERVPSYLAEFCALARRRKPRIVLSSMKAFAGQGRFLEFSGSGLCFSIDLPRRHAEIAFLNELDRIDIQHGAKANLVKDSRLGKDVVEAQYPEYGAFRDALRRFDPERRFASDLSRRLDL